MASTSHRPLPSAPTQTCKQRKQHASLVIPGRIRSLMRQKRDDSAALPRRLAARALDNPSAPEGAADNIMQKFCAGFRTLPELDYYISPAMIEGKIPKELHGTFLQNGPGLFEVGGHTVSHPYDADGMVCSLAIKEELAFFRSRYVKTADFAKGVRSAHDMRGAAGSWLFNPLDMSTKNPANKGILYVGRQLYALHEAGLPIHLDSHTLETTGPSTIAGALKETSSLAARYRVVTGTDGFEKLIAFDASQVGPDAAVSIFEMALDGGLLAKKFVTLQGGALGFIQDIAVTQNFYLLVQNPCSVNLEKLMSEHMQGASSAADCLYLDKTQKAKIHVIPRDAFLEGAEGMRTFELDSFLTLQHVNAFEVNDGKTLVLDTLSWRDFDFTANVFSSTKASVTGTPAANLERIQLHLGTGKVLIQQLSRRACHYHATNPKNQGRSHQFTYLAASSTDDSAGPPQALVKIKSEPVLGKKSSVGTVLWEPGKSYFLGQPHFVPRAQKMQLEDDGWLVATLYDSRKHQSSVVILDALNMNDGPVASINLPHHIPHGLGSTFLQGTYLGPARTAPRGWKPAS